MIDLLMHKSMMFTSESGKGVLLPFVWAEYLDATTATPPHLSRQQPTHALTDSYTIHQHGDCRRPCYLLLTVVLQEREGSEDQDMASDLRLPPGHRAADLPFSFPPGLGGVHLPALEALNKQQKELLVGGGSSIVLPTSSPQGLLKAHSTLFPSPHHGPGFPPMRPPSQVTCTRHTVQQQQSRAS